MITENEQKEIAKLIDLFLDRVIEKIKFNNDDEKTGAWLLKEYQFNQAQESLRKLSGLIK